MARARARPLDAYNSKRDFAKTAEPKGAAPKKQGRAYLIQKHAATRLHYDFRLEHGGVLLSWAVPKGPSLDPAERRLAVRTEDHPVAYGDFEGTIPKGEYGGGTVMLWDRGRWAPVGDVDSGLEKGELKFDLEGERLSGRWALVRMNVERGRENWLLIKDKDSAASRTESPVEDFGTSIATGRTMEQIGSGDAAPAAPAAPRKRTKARPRFAPPQLATLVESAPEGGDWLHEIKYDGYRVICALGKGGAKFFTRNGKDWTGKFAALAPALEALEADSALIDGEICVLDSEGRSDFKRLQNALRAGARERLVLFAFDLPSLDGRSLARRPLAERKERLRALMERSDPKGPLRYSDHIAGQGPQFHAQACEAGLEGIVSKKADSRYVSARSRAWLKTKCVRRQEFVVGGYSPSDKDSRGIASLLLGVWDDGRLCYAGRVGAGFTQGQTRVWKKRLDAARAANPFTGVPREAARDAVFARPERVVEVSFTEWTGDGRLRHPVFIAEREDKPAEAIVKETPKSPRAAPKGGRGAAEREEARVGGVRLTNPDRVLYPDQGVTKRDLADYYLAVADRILPFLKDRPVSIVRCPQGAESQCFYQRHAHKGAPPEIGAVRIREKEGEGEYLLLDTAAALVASAQIGGLELHPWGARTDDLERPDMMIFDLDPGEGVDFAQVRRAALEVRGVLEAAGLRSFLKATGGKGLHVVAPLTRRRGWDAVKSFARAVAERMEEADPDRYVATMAKARRKGRIFIDYLRNDRGNTAVAPFSPRARPGASVAVPLGWDELDGLERADSHDIQSVRARLEREKADPWAEFFTLRQSVTEAAMKAVGARP